MPKIQRFVPARSSTKRVRNTSLRLRSGVALRFRNHPLFPLYQMHSFIYFFHFISQSYRFFPGLYFCTCLFAGVSAWYAEWGTDTHLDTFTDQTPKAFGISFKALQNCWWVHVIIWTRLWDCILNNSCSSRCSVATANTALPPVLGIIIKDQARSSWWLLLLEPPSARRFGWRSAPAVVRSWRWRIFLLCLKESKHQLKDGRLIS